MEFWRLHRHPVPDEDLARRVRDRLRMLVRYPEAITVSARRGVITLSGPILADEVEYLVRLLRRLEGVKEVANRLHVYEEAETVPELRSLLRYAPWSGESSSMAAPGSEVPAETGPGGKGLTNSERVRLLKLRKKAHRITDELTRGRRPPPDHESTHSEKEDHMARIRDVMTPQVEVISPDATAEEAADRMKQLNVGVIPVCDEQGLVGMLTDRDLVVRVMGTHRDPKAVLVGEVMTPDIIYGFEDQDVQEAAMLMAEKQIRRLPVLDRDRHLVGIVSLGDLAVHGRDQELSGQVLEEVSHPSEPKR